MSGNKKKTTTTTTPTQGVASQIQQIIGQGTGGFSTGAGAGSTSTPGVTSKLAGDLLPFTLAHQLPWFQAPSGSLVTDSAGNTQISYSAWVSLIHQIKDHPTLLDRVQHSMAQAGLLPKSWSNYGNLDKATTSAWENLGQSAIGGSESATSLLNSGLQEGQLGSVLQGIKSTMTTAQRGADAVSSVNVSLTDPNEIAQKFATAMESMGLGAPTPEVTQKFVDAFRSGPQGEIQAAQNQSEVQKENYKAGFGKLNTAYQDASMGNLQGAQAAENMTGPTYVATKTMPNLDAESIAAAKAQNPGMYYATGTTYLYGLIQRALAGGLQVPTSPSSPSSQTTGGAIVTSPLAGTM